MCVCIESHKFIKENNTDNNLYVILFFHLKKKTKTKHLTDIPQGITFRSCHLNRDSMTLQSI